METEVAEKPAQVEKTAQGKEKKRHYVVKTIGGESNGKKRIKWIKKTRKWYPTEDSPRPYRYRGCPKEPRLRKSITPGTVLILLAGRHQGKRVVFLKQLPSGLLLVTGPFKVNRVPLRRVNQSYVIATRTKVDMSDVKIPDEIDDVYFKRGAVKEKRRRGKRAEIFQDSDKKYTVNDKRKDDQKAVDSQLLPHLKAVPQLRSYLSRKFFLSNGQYPHRMVF